MKNVNDKRLAAYGYRVGRLHRLYFLCIKESMTKIGISNNLVPFLSELYFQDGISQETLSKTIYVEKASISRGLSRLEKLGLVIRIENEENKREKLVYLTEKAKEIQDRYFSVLFETSNIMALGFNNEEKTKMYDFFDRMSKNLNQLLNKQTDSK